VATAPERTTAAEAAADFVWRDGGRLVVFQVGLIATAPRTLADHGFGAFELFSTPRARAAAPALVAAAAASHDVASAPVAAAAGRLLGDVCGALPLVALGGGRVIDTAKAVAAMLGLEVATLATTMSGAEMTDLHALPKGASRRGHLRPALVLADPDVMTSAPEPALRASSMNALAHGADSLYTPYANPMSRHAALRGAALIAGALDQAREERDRAALALGSILCGYAIDSGGLGIHHVVCQTLAHVIATPHAHNNAAVLPHALGYLVGHDADGMTELAAALDVEPGSLPARVAGLGEPLPIGSFEPDPGLVPTALDAMLVRRELSFVPGPPRREDLAAIVSAAW
jgi:maleylacetate reductase